MKTCEQCHKEFKTEGYMLIVKEMEFCSNLCRNNWLKDNNLSILSKRASETH